MDITAEKCRAAAEVLSEAAERMPEQQRFALCAQCLELMAREDWRPGDYQPLVKPFIDEAGALLSAIAAMRGQTADEIGDCCFELVECLAVIFRERALRRPDAQFQALEKLLLDYFEGCGHWRPDDATLVSHFYYTLLPSSLRPD